MRIVWVRRISQVFFLLLFFWFCVVTTLGNTWWQLDGWPVNWLIQLDPLVGLGTLLATRVLFGGLLWGLATILLTILLGRFFCGWLCPLGTVQQVIGYLARWKKKRVEQIDANQYRPAQRFKYGLLAFLLAASLIDVVAVLFQTPPGDLWVVWALLAISIFWILGLAVIPLLAPFKSSAIVPLAGTFIILFASGPFPVQGIGRAMLQSGLFDPIPLMHRSVNLVLMPMLGSPAFAVQRFYQGAWLIGVLFSAILLLNLAIPRFYCRFVCPLGALLGLLGRNALWRIGKVEDRCRDCHQCERNCEGACTPSVQIRPQECILCMNCREDCHHGLIGYRLLPSATGEDLRPNLSRRGFILSVVTGAASVPMLRIGGATAANWNPRLVRPPGALVEYEFLSRCVKCGQCMRICPTNVIQPAVLEAGLEGLWTPVLNFRIGSSGCQLNCIACGHLCPTAAIRPLHLDERYGRGLFEKKGPIRMGTAFVDRGRCLPWAMDRPCIVCQENCPVSPKAIRTKAVFMPVGANPLRIAAAGMTHVDLESGHLEPDHYATGDYFCKIIDGADEAPRRIVRNDALRVEISAENPWQTVPGPGDRLLVLIRLQQPHVDPDRCIGCGICEHECPVRGLRAIRVTAENETRSMAHRMVLQNRPRVDIER